eukprot:14004-Heterococcus_DN1.PRE.4
MACVPSDHLAARHCTAIRMNTNLQWSQRTTASASTNTLWACERLTCPDVSATSDEALCDVIRARLAPHGRVSFAEIARAALAVGRRSLATMLLDLEPLAGDQVPLLLSMGEDERALQRAITSGDCDLVTLALLHIERSSYTTNTNNTANSSSSGNKGSSSVRDQDAVYKLVHAYPEALSLLKEYYKSRSGFAERQQLHQLLMFKGHYLEAGTMAVQLICLAGEHSNVSSTSSSSSAVAVGNAAALSSEALRLAKRFK